MIKIGTVSLGLSGTPLDQLFHKAAALGAECIELNSRVQRHHGHVWTPAIADAVRGYAQDAGVKIGSVSGYCDFAQKNPADIDGQIETLMQACRIAADLDVKLVRAFVGDRKDQNDTYERYHDTIVKALQRAADRAAVMGLTLALENHGRLLNDGVKLAALVKEVDSAHIKITLDTGNFAWAGHHFGEVQEDFAAVLPYVANVHVKDGEWTEDGNFELVAAGDGQLRIDELIKKLIANGYDEYIYSEYEGPNDFKQETRRSIAYLKQVVGR